MKLSDMPTDGTEFENPEHYGVLKFFFDENGYLCRGSKSWPRTQQQLNHVNVLTGDGWHVIEPKKHVCSAWCSCPNPAKPKTCGAKWTWLNGGTVINLVCSLLAGHEPMQHEALRDGFTYNLSITRDHEGRSPAPKLPPDRWAVVDEDGFKVAEFKLEGEAKNYIYIRGSALRVVRVVLG